MVSDLIEQGYYLEKKDVLILVLMEYGLWRIWLSPMDNLE